MTETSEKIGNGRLKRLIRLLINIAVPLVIVAAALGFYKHQMNTRPQAQRRPLDTQARLVTVETVRRQTQPVVLHAMGTVRPAKEVTLSPEVAGVILAMDPAVIPGGRVRKGQTLYQIDARDYQTIVHQRQSELTQAELNLTLELASQKVAQQEYELLGELIDEADKPLVLREPQLQSAHRAVEAARAALAKAELDVQRCTLVAPFDAIIKSKHVDVGTRVALTTPLVVLTCTEEYWVETLIPMEQLHWLKLPEGQDPGSPVKVYNGTPDRFRAGRVVQLLGHLEEAGRMAQVLVSVADPLATPDGAAQLLIGAYVRVEIEGLPLTDAVVLPREYLRDGDFVWVMNDQDTLEIRPVKIAFRGRNDVYLIDGLDDGCRVVTSDLSSPVHGMPLRLEDVTGTEKSRTDEGRQP